jgi:uncharacterized protein YdeI (YjbR/CyaY-like superfamily)
MGQAGGLPSELVSVAGNAAASTAFFALPPSHRFEYVKWVVEAKQPQTRLSRAQKTLEKLAPSGARS